MSWSALLRRQAEALGRQAEALGRRLDTPRGAVVCLAGIWFLHACFNLSFILADNSVPEWMDRLPHLRRVYDGVLYLHIFGLRGLPDAPTLSDSHWPPLVYWASALLGHLVDPSLSAMRVYNLFYLALLLIGAFRIGVELHGRHAGLLAAWVVAAVPGLVGGSRQFGLDYPGAVFVCLGVAALLGARGFGRMRSSLLFGVILGLAVLVRAQAAVFLAGPLLVVLIRIVHGRRWNNLARVAMALLAALVVSSVWWHQHGLTLLRMLGQHFGQGAFPVNEVNTSPLHGVVYYLYSLASASSLPLVALLVPLAAIGLRRRPSRGGRWELLAWLLVPLAFHAVMVVRLARYVLPLLPVLPLVAAVGALGLRRRGPRLAACGLLVLGGFLTLFVCHRVAMVTRSPMGELGCPRPGSPPKALSTTELPAFLAPGRLPAATGEGLGGPTRWPTCSLPGWSQLTCGGCLNRTLRADESVWLADQLALAIVPRHTSGEGVALLDHMYGMRSYSPLFESTLLRLQELLPLVIVLRNDEVAGGLPQWKLDTLGAAPTLYLVDEQERDDLQRARLVGRFSTKDRANTVFLWRIDPASRYWRILQPGSPAARPGARGP